MKFGKYSIGIMGNLSNIFNEWLTPHYFKPRKLLLESSVKIAGYQQYRWLKFYIIISGE